MTKKNWASPQAGKYSWSVPQYIINGYVLASVYGSPGQGFQGGSTAGSGFGAFIQGSIPVTPGQDSFDVYAADGTTMGWGTYGYHKGSAGGKGNNKGYAGGWGGGSSAIVRHSDQVVMIEAAGGGGDGGNMSTGTPYVAGPGGRAGNAIGVEGIDGAPGASGTENTGMTPSVNVGAGTHASQSAPGDGGVPPGGGTGFGQAGVPSGSGIGGDGGADTYDDGGGGGGGGGAYGGGGGAGSYGGGGGAGGGPGLSVVDPSVTSVSFAGYSKLFGSVQLWWTEADAPLAPSWVYPLNGGYAELAVAPTIQFTYNPAADSGPLQQWAFQNNTTGKYWSAATQAWVGTIAWNDVGYLNLISGNTYSYTFPNGAFADGSAIQMSIACAEGYFGLGTTSPAWATITVTGAPAPKVTVSAPTYQSNVNTTTPTLSWTETLATGATQSKYQIKVYNASEVGLPRFTPGINAPYWDSGVVSSTALSATLGTLPPDTYQAYVQVTDSNGETNQWGSTGSWTEFTVRLVTYATPTFTAVPGKDPNNGAPVAVLTVTPADSPTAVSVQYSDDGGATWHPVIGATMVPWSSGSIQMLDYTIPIGVPHGPPRDYRAEVNGTSGTYAAVSNWAQVNNVQVSTTGPLGTQLLPGAGLGQWWISDPQSGGGAPSPTKRGTTPPVPSAGTGAGSLGLNRTSTSGGYGSGSATSSFGGGIPDASISVVSDQEEQQNTVYPFGRSVPITTRGDFYDEALSSGVAMLFFEQQEYDTFNQLRGRRKTLVLRSDMGDVWYGILGADRYTSIIRSAMRATKPIRELSMTFTPASPPSA